VVRKFPGCCLDLFLRLTAVLNFADLNYGVLFHMAYIQLQ
jgi:hypothetical protein